jgi:hypothetical protein
MGRRIVPDSPEYENLTLTLKISKDIEEPMLGRSVGSNFLNNPSALEFELD